MGVLIAMLGLIGTICAAGISANAYNNATESAEKIAKDNNTVANVTAQTNKEASQYTADTNALIAKDTNQKNEDIAKLQIQAQKDINAQNIAFQESENTITRQREDNALQRKMADGLAAGLSPLGAMGYTGASSQALTAPSADGTGIMNALSSLMGSNSTSASNQMNSNNSLLNSKINSNNSVMAQKIQNNMNYADLKFKQSQQQLEQRKLQLQTINDLLSQYRDFKTQSKQIELLNENIKTAQYKNDYYNKYGYNEFNQYTFLSQLLDIIGYDKNSVKDKFNEFKNTLPLPDIKTGNIDLKSLIPLPNISKKDNSSTNKEYKYNIPTLSYNDYFKTKSKLENGYKLTPFDRSDISNLFKANKNELPKDWYNRYLNSSGFRTYVYNQYSRMLKDVK